MMSSPTPRGGSLRISHNRSGTQHDVQGQARRRAEARRGLGTLQKRQPRRAALPRGGVPVGFEVAAHLRAPLDILLARKIGAPGHEELALGAVIDGFRPQVVVNERSSK